jgi:predicted Zn-dependent peptidase
MIILCLLNILYCDKSKTNFKKYRFEPLKQVSEFYIKEYSNGLRHVHIPSNSNIIHAAVTINVGTRHEEVKLNGIAHFVEHLLFKGTKSRKTFHILNRIDSVGGELNAYTTKEETCIYASCTKEYFERALDILADVSFHSIFPEKEIEKEREVIIDEIGSYLDTPSEQIFDDFEELIFKNHPLAKNILGTEESLQNIGRKDIVKFVTTHYVPSNMVLSTYGNCDAKDLQVMVEKYFISGSPKAKTPSTIKLLKPRFFPFQKTIERNTNQAHVVIGNKAPGAKDKHRHAALLLNNIFGGPGMNSMLNLNIREKYGYAYNLDSSFNTFSDAGLFTVYFGSEQKHIPKIISLIEKEMKQLRDHQLSASKIASAKRQLIGNIALAQENKSSLTIGLGKSLLVHNKVDSLDALYKKINAVSANDLLEIANILFDNKSNSILEYR